MPYKDPEHRRQWEREHREERNARRRKSSSSRLPELSNIDVPLPDRNSAQPPLSTVSVATGLTVGLAFLLTVLFLMRRVGSSPDPVQVPERQSPELLQEGF